MKSDIFSIETKRKILEAVENAIIECGLQHTFNIISQDPVTEAYNEQPIKVKVSLDFQFPGSGNRIVCNPEIKL